MKGSQDFWKGEVDLLLNISVGGETLKGLLLLNLCAKDPLTTTSRAFQVLGIET